MKKIIVTLLLVTMIIGSTMSAFAANVGDTKSNTTTWTYSQIEDICDQLAGAYMNSDGTVWAGIVGDLSGVSGSGVYSAVWTLIKNDVKSDYDFFIQIKQNMKKNNYSRVSILYTVEYKKFKIGNEPFFAWAYKSKSVSRYQN